MQVTRWANFAVYTLAALLCIAGLYTLHEPHTHEHAGWLETFEQIVAYAMLIGAALLIYFRQPAAENIRWFAARVHRWLSAIFLSALFGLESLLHVLGIPHMEGWWIPLLGSGALFSAIAIWFGKWKRKR